MIKYNSDRKIERITLDIEPDTTSPSPGFHQKLLEKFNDLTPQQRATIIEFGFEMLDRKAQLLADSASGI